MVAIHECSNYLRRDGIAERIACAHCKGYSVGAATVTTEVVYLRCGDCGQVWSIRDRRQRPRADDRPKF